MNLPRAMLGAGSKGRGRKSGRQKSEFADRPGFGRFNPRGRPGHSRATSRTRDMLAREGERLRDEITRYATLNQHLMTAMKVIAENLQRWKGESVNREQALAPLRRGGLAVTCRRSNPSAHTSWRDIGSRMLGA